VTAAARTSTSAEWSFLGVRIKELRVASTGPVVVEAALPEGASPPLHEHDDIDDSFFVLDGTMVVRCGSNVSLATPGTWVAFPRLVPHTFRVMDGPARVLLVHANTSFVDAVHDIGEPATPGGRPAATAALTSQELSRALAAHGIRTVGEPMEEPEARRWLSSLAGDPGTSVVD